MITSFFSFDGCTAIPASTPALLLRQLEEAVRLLVFRALAPAMGLTVAHAADLGLTAAAFAILSTCIVHVDMSRLDPLPATAGGAVDPILARIFLIFAVPLDFELDVE